MATFYVNDSNLAAVAQHMLTLNVVPGHTQQTMEAFLKQKALAAYQSHSSTAPSVLYGMPSATVYNPVFGHIAPYPSTPHPTSDAVVIVLTVKVTTSGMLQSTFSSVHGAVAGQTA